MSGKPSIRALPAKPLNIGIPRQRAGIKVVNAVPPEGTTILNFRFDAEMDSG